MADSYERFARRRRGWADDVCAHRSDASDHAAG